ncbi:MAG: SPOR domain-containing protein [Candidatus Symbiothrix sp.]|jgi:hypothetical protein|nr:SPOR domain-containing protein [Candidatus Symbiothrix sp.]
MNKIIKGIILLVLCVNQIHAQTIVDDLQTVTNASDGVIRVECPSSVIALIGKPNASVSLDLNGEVLVRSGYRVLVFMGGNSRTARAEANRKQADIKEAFPELATYIRYDAPNWRLLVGDCTSRDEALLLKQKLQHEFPDFGQEMYIVSDKVKIQNSQTE